MKEMTINHDVVIAPDELGAVFANLPIVVARFDPGGECVGATLSPGLNLPFDTAALVGRSIDNLIGFADASGARQWQDELTRRGRSDCVPVLVRAGGQEHHMVASAQLCRKGKLKQQGAGTLVILRKESAAETEQRENFFLAEIARRISNPIVITGADRRITWVNDAFVTRTGHTQKEARGKRPADLVQFESTDPETAARLSAALARNEPVSVEIRNRSKTGEEYWLELDIRPLYRPDGTFFGYMDVQTDLTRRKALIEKAESASRRAMARAAEITRSRRQLREAIDTLPYGFAMYDDKDRLIIVNDNFRKLVRGEATKIVHGARYDTIMREVVETGGFLPTEAEREKWLKEKIEGSRKPYQEFHYRKHDTGQWVQALDKRTPDGGLVSMRIDITNLKSTEERLASIVEGAGVGTWLWRSATDVSEIDALWAAMLGYTREELGEISYGRFAAMVHPDDQAVASTAWNGLNIGVGDVCETIFRMQHKDGHWVSILSRGRVMRRNAEGHCEIVSGVHIDVTEHKEREDALAQALRDKQVAEQRFFDIAGVSDDWLWEQDENLRFTWYSDSFSRVTGTDPGYMIGKTRREFYEKDARVLAAADWDWLEARMAAREPFRNFQYMIYPKGSDRPAWLRASGSPVFDADGKFCGYRGIGTNVTALVEARENAEEASRTKSLFLANMSHEIRTPLNGVLGMAELLESQIIDPAKRQMVSTIRESGESLLAILNDLLDMSKIEAGRMELEALPFRPADLAEKIESLNALWAEEKGLGFEVLTGSGARLYRLGDPNRVRQILNNLISNAIKFTSKGEVVVTITARKGSTLVIEVQDTGIGMSEEQSVRLFRDFTQADASITRRFGGTGLGLAIVGRLVDMMGGKINVESVPDEGTHITVELPLAECAAPTETAALAASAQTCSLEGVRVLAADDNQTNRVLLREVLSQRGVEVTLVANGAQAVEAWAPERFDVLVLDISMPVMDGITALAQIRAAAEAAGAAPVPAIAFTANAMAHLVVDYVEAGFDGHVAKPFRANDLVRAIATLLPRRG